MMDRKLIQVSSGRGPHECAWVVAQVLHVVLLEAKGKNLSCDILHKSNGSLNGTVSSATIAISGHGVADFLNNWLGTIQWIGESPFRKHHKRKNWFIKIFELDVTKKTLVSESEITYQTIRSSGAGGQHVNKVSTCVRAVYAKNGMSVTSSESRSQHQNKKIAKEKLLRKIEDHELDQLRNTIEHNWLNQMDIKRGRATRIFKSKDMNEIK